jgi:hypothetical protein
MGCVIARFPVLRGKACNSAQVDYIRFTCRLRKDYSCMTKELGRKLLRPEEAVARLHKDYACRVCRGYKCKTDRCQIVVPMSVQAQRKGELHPLRVKISQDFPRIPFSPWPNTATVSQSLVLRLTTATAIPGFPILKFSLAGHRSGKLVSLQDVGPDQHLDLPPEITATRTSPSQGHRKLPRQDSRQSLSQPATTLAAAGALGLSPHPEASKLMTVTGLGCACSHSCTRKRLALGFISELTQMLCCQPQASK